MPARRLDPGRCVCGSGTASFRKRGGAVPAAARPGADCLGDRGKNLTLIGAMSDEGLIATMTLTGRLDTASF